jgi:hypothetical protein
VSGDKLVTLSTNGVISTYGLDPGNLGLNWESQRLSITRNQAFTIVLDRAELFIAVSNGNPYVKVFALIRKDLLEWA